MPGQIPNKNDEVRRRHDQLVQGIPADLSGALESGRNFEANFQQIHTEAEQIAHTAFSPVGQRVECTRPEANHLVEHIQAVHDHSRALAQSTLPGVARRDMTSQEMQRQRQGIGNIRRLVDQNRQVLTALRGHLDSLHAKLTELEQLYSQ